MSWWPVSVQVFTSSPVGDAEAAAAVRRGLAVSDVDQATVRPVESIAWDRRAIGAAFEVRAPTLGRAAEHAVDLVQRACSDAGIIVDELHEVTVENAPREEEPATPAEN